MINKFLATSLVAFTLACPIHAADSQKHVIVMVDLSGSNPARDARFATSAAKTIAADIAKLNVGFGDKFSLRSAGDLDPMAHLPWSVDDTFAYGQAEPNDVPRFLRDRLGGLSNEVPHSEADVVGALSRLAGTCTPGTDLSVFVVSNMVDAGHVEGDHFFYPNLPGAVFDGCNAQITLIGFGMNAGQYDHFTIAAAKEVVTAILTEAGFTVAIK